MRRYAKVFLTGLLALAFRGFAATDNPMQWIEVSGYKLTETGDLQPIGGLGGLSVTPGEGVVYSNGESYADNLNVFAATVPFGYRVGKWKKAYDDPFVLTKGEDVEGSEGATSVTIPWEDRGNVVYLALILELDDRRTVTIGKTPFGAGTVGTNLGTYACMKGDVFRLDAVPEHDSQTGFDRSSFRRWSDGVTSGRRTVTVDTNLTLIAEFVPKSWEVSFDANGGSVSPTSKRVTCDAAYGWLPTPVRLGNKFDGWYGETEASAPVGFETTVGAVGDHWLHARWTPMSYLIDCDYSGEGNGLVEGTGRHPYGSSVSLTAKPYDGSVFAGWGDGETRNPRLVTVESNALYCARFDVKTYEVTFTYRNAEGREVVSPVQTVRHGEAAVPPAAQVYDSWPYHYFKTWSNDEYKSVTRSLTGDRSVRAIYDDETFAVTFVYRGRDGNAVTTMPQHVVAGAAAVPPPTSVTDNWAGHTLTGWQPDYSVIRTDLTVEAVYVEDPVSCTVDFAIGGDGNGTVDGIGKFLCGTTVELTAKPYEGSVFVGWEDGETRNPRRVTVTSNVVYGVRFDVATYDVTFTYRDATGRELVSDVQTVRYGGAAVPPDASACDGWPYHTFKTWSTEEYKAVKHDLTGDRSVRAIYDEETFAVTFVYRGRDGNAVTTMPQHVVAGASAVPPPDSVADNWAGHKRVDWQPDFSVIRSDLTVEAVYEEYFTVGFVVSGEGNGKVEGAGRYRHDDQVMLTAIPDEGSVFARWEDGEMRNPRRVTVTSNAVYGVRFDVATYDVTFTYRDETGREVVSDVQTVRYGEAAVPPDVSTADGWPYHTFKTWSTEEYKAVKRSLTGDRSVRAIYDSDTFAVTFVYRGRDGNAVTTMPQHVVAGASAVPPSDADNWTGHTLVDWQPDFSVVRSDLTVEAAYELNVHNVDFVYMNRESVESTQRHRIEFGGLVPFDAVSSLTTEWPNHAFRHWSIGGAAVSGDVVVSNDLRVVAVYEGATYYDVTFVYNDQDGNAVTTMPQQVLAGTSAVPPPDSVANKWNGHTLTGWHPDFSVIRSDLIVEAIYDADVNVDYVVSGDGDGIVEGVGQYAVGSSVTLTATPREGSEFVGWEDGETHNPRRVIVTSNVTYGVRFDLKTYDVTFIYHNKDGREVAENKKAKHGKAAELPNESDYNNWLYHTFSGWSSTDYNAVTRNLTGNDSIKAEYKEYALVIYDANGGEGGQLVDTNYTGKVTLKTNTFMKEGYVFQCWTNTAKQVSGKENEKEFPVELGARNQFDACWKPIKYRLRFDGNGDGDEVKMVGLDPKELTYDEPFSLTSSYPECYAERSFWRIAGWDQNPKCSPESVKYKWEAADTMTVSNLTTTAEATVTFYAIWRKAD